MEWLSRPTRRLILEMSVGVILYNVVLSVLAWIFHPKLEQILQPWYPAEAMPVVLGLMLGAAGAVLMLVHMAVMTERVLESRNEVYANKTTVMHSMIRKLVFVAALFFFWNWFRINLLAMVIGAMGMKAGAYMQPLIHKVFGQEDRSGQNFGSAPEQEQEGTTSVPSGPETF